MNLDPTWIASNSADSIGTLEQREAVMAAKVAVGNELELLYQKCLGRRFMWSGVWGSIPVSPCSTTASCVANLDVNGPPTNRRNATCKGLRHAELHPPVAGLISNPSFSCQGAGRGRSCRHVLLVTGGCDSDVV